MPEKKETAADEYTRGDFLALLISVGGGLIGLAMSGLGLGYFLAPAWRKPKEGWVDLGAVKEIPEGKPVKIEYISRHQDGWITLEGRSSVWVLRDGATITAFSPNCTHLGCAYRWDDAKQSFLCPCHTGVFSKTGEVVSGPPPRPLDQFQAKIENGILLVLPKEKAA